MKLKDITNVFQFHSRKKEKRRVLKKLNQFRSYVKSHSLTIVKKDDDLLTTNTISSEKKDASVSTMPFVTKEEQIQALENFLSVRLDRSTLLFSAGDQNLNDKQSITINYQKEEITSTNVREPSSPIKLIEEKPIEKELTSPSPPIVTEEISSPQQVQEQSICSKVDCKSPDECLFDCQAFFTNAKNVDEIDNSTTNRRLPKNVNLSHKVLKKHASLLVTLSPVQFNDIKKLKSNDLTNIERILSPTIFRSHRVGPLILTKPIDSSHSNNTTSTTTTATTTTTKTNENKITMKKKSNEFQLFDQVQSCISVCSGSSDEQIEEKDKTIMSENISFLKNITIGTSVDLADSQNDNIRAFSHGNGTVILIPHLNPKAFADSLNALRCTSPALKKDISEIKETSTTSCCETFSPPKTTSRVRLGVRGRKQFPIGDTNNNNITAFLSAPLEQAMVVNDPSMFTVTEMKLGPQTRQDDNYYLQIPLQQVPPNVETGRVPYFVMLETKRPILAYNNVKKKPVGAAKKLHPFVPAQICYVGPMFQRPVSKDPYTEPLARRLRAFPAEYPHHFTKACYKCCISHGAYVSERIEVRPIAACKTCFGKDDELLRKLLKVYNTAYAVQTGNMATRFFQSRPPDIYDTETNKNNADIKTKSSNKQQKNIFRYFCFKN